MPSMERHERGDPNTSPALGVTDQYSKGRPSGQRELAAACEAGLALHRAGEKWAAVEAALRMLTAADGLGFRRALLFLLASDGTALAGAAAARRVRPSRQPGEERAREGMLDERLTNAIRAMRFSTGTEKESPLLRVMAEGHPVRLTASELQGCLDGDRHRLPGVRAWWLLPVTGSGQPLGILLLEEAGRGPWTSRAQLAKRLAAHLGQTIVQREGERALLETTAKLRTLRESVRELLAAGTLPDLLQLAARAGLRSAGGGCALLWTYDERTHQLDLAVHLPAAKEHSLEEWLPHLDPLAQAALLSGAVRRYPDLRAEEGFGLGGHP
jgi:hypothetical protein